MGTEIALIVTHALYAIAAVAIVVECVRLRGPARRLAERLRRPG